LFLLSFFFFLFTFLFLSLASQRPTNISIKIDTTKEFATDSDQEHDLEKSEASVFIQVAL